jgi:GDP-4-dehydro-6-deoxy-D-mannose reductase
MRALITGVGGFAGQHLAAALLADPDARVFGIARGRVDWHRRDICDEPRLSLLRADLQVASEVVEAFREAAPERVYLLAAMSAPAEAFADPLGTLDNNIACVTNALEAVRQAAPTARVLLVSSGEIYGSSPDASITLDEDRPLAPENPYALSKVTQDLLGYQYHRAFGLDVVRVRPFNHIGPGQSARFAASSFARQIARAEAGLGPYELEVGSLAAVRDFTDVRDMVRAYVLALESCEAGAAYNLASGRGTSIQALLDGLVALARVPVTVRQDPARLRPIDARYLVGDATRFRARTGWRPTIPLEDTLAAILEDWRVRVRAE